MKNKEWLKKEIEKIWHSGHPRLGEVVEYEALKRLINQLDEPEITDPTLSKKGTVEVPIFVADWHEENKHHILGSKFKKMERDEDEKIKGWYNNCKGRHPNPVSNAQETIAKMDLYGYTIEQPKLLTVIVKDCDKTIMNKQLPEDEVNKMMEGMTNDQTHNQSNPVLVSRV